MELCLGNPTIVHTVTIIRHKNIKEALYVNALEGKYIIADKTLAVSLQKLADNYIFDSKILALIDSNDEFEEIAKNEIDGVIYKKLLK